MRRRLPDLFVRLAGHTRGATAIEYGLIIACMTLAIIAAMHNLAGGSGSLWSRVSNDATNSL